VALHSDRDTFNILNGVTEESSEGPLSDSNLGFSRKPPMPIGQATTPLWTHPNAFTRNRTAAFQSVVRYFSDEYDLYTEVACLSLALRNVGILTHHRRRGTLGVVII